MCRYGTADKGHIDRLPGRVLTCRGRRRTIVVQALSDAAELVRKAIQKLDDAGAPADIAAHLDLALSRIADELAGSRNS